MPFRVDTGCLIHDAHDVDCRGAEYSKRGNVVDQLRRIASRKHKQFLSRLDICRFGHLICFKMIHAGRAVIDSIDFTTYNLIIALAHAEIWQAQVTWYRNESRLEVIVPEIPVGEDCFESCVRLLA